jgi:hypothetical protein
MDSSSDSCPCNTVVGHGADEEMVHMAVSYILLHLHHGKIYFLQGG